MRYRLRPATDDDYNFLYQLHVHTMQDTVEAAWGWDEAFQERYFRERFDPDASQIVIVGGQDVGVLKVEEREGGLFLGLIEVAPAYQGRGLGTAIIQDILAKAGAENRPVALHVLKSNDAARRLYRRLGFQVVEEREKRYVMRWTPSSPESLPG